jgi:hypothetical protein
MSEPPAEIVGQLGLARLGDGYPGLTPNGGIHLAQACAVCLQERRHISGSCSLATRGAFEASYKLVWSEVGDQVFRQWNDQQETTEEGAVGIGILIITHRTEYQVVLRSRKGTGFDYWLGRKDDALFQSSARLEVSGIRVGLPREIDRRVESKIQQTKRSDEAFGTLPAFVVVVEFGAPVAVVAKR